MYFYKLRYIYVYRYARWMLSSTHKMTISYSNYCGVAIHLVEPAEQYLAQYVQEVSMHVSLVYSEGLMEDFI